VVSGHCGSDKFPLNARRVRVFYALSKMAVKNPPPFYRHSEKRDNKKATRESGLTVCIY
jgi:hypothetical protein